MIPQIEPWIGEEELQEVTQVILSTWITEGEKTALFEQKFAAFTEAKHAIAVNNATIGLYMCLKVLGIGPGDEVIVPDFTFIATVNSVIMAGAEPVLVDIDRQTFNLEPKGLEAAITPRTKAIIPVHIYGQAADMEAINQIAKRYGLFVVEDAAQGVGVRFQGKHVGHLGDVGCFSFYGNKTMTTGEGGMITTDDDEIAGKCWMLKNHGRTKKGTFVHEHIGYNFCFTDLQAAIGLAQMSKLDTILQKKTQNLKLYKAYLADVEEVEFPDHDPRCETVAWFTNILVADPQQLQDYLAQEGIGTRRFFYPIHRQPCYEGKLGKEFPNVEYAYAHGLSLPSSATISDEQIRMACEKIRSLYCL